MQTSTESKTAACGKCQYWEAKAEAGECRRHAPQTVVLDLDDGVKFESRFPTTSSDDWCGDFEAK